MAEYIEREKIGLTDLEIILCKGSYKEALKMLLEKIDAIPAVDVLPVVRCRDCEYWDLDWRSRYGDDRHYCPMVDQETWDNWYCADGEKRR